MDESYVSVGSLHPVDLVACDAPHPLSQQALQWCDQRHRRHALQEELAFIWVLLITTVCVTFFIEHHKITAIPPSGAAMALGMVFGGIGRLAGMPRAPALACARRSPIVHLKEQLLTAGCTFASLGSQGMECSIAVVHRSRCRTACLAHAILTVGDVCRPDSHPAVLAGRILLRIAAPHRVRRRLHPEEAGILPQLW